MTLWNAEDGTLCGAGARPADGWHAAADIDPRLDTTAAVSLCGRRVRVNGYGRFEPESGASCSVCSRLSYRYRQAFSARNYLPEAAHRAAVLTTTAGGGDWIRWHRAGFCTGRAR